MTTRDDKLKTIKNWMSFFHLSWNDIDVESFDELDDAQLDALLETAEEDRARHATEGVLIKPDYSDAVEFEA